MAGSDDDPSGDPHRLPRTLATARNAALDRVELLLERVAPQSGAGDRDGEAREGSARGGGDRSTGNGWDSGGGSGPVGFDVSRGGRGGIGSGELGCMCHSVLLG